VQGLTTDSRIEEAKRQLSMAEKAAVDTNASGVSDARSVKRWQTRGHFVLLLLSVSAAAVVGLAIAKFPLIPTIIAIAGVLLFGTMWAICGVKQKSASTSEISNFKESAGWDTWTGNMKFYIAGVKEGKEDKYKVRGVDDPEWQKLDRRRQQIKEHRWNDIETEHEASYQELDARAQELMQLAERALRSE
jgi:hypothetical protein